MIKKIGKVCISLIIALLLAFVAWYFLLIKLPEHQIMGTAAPVMTKEEALDLMDYHGVKVIWVEGGEWFFRRDGEDCKLIRKQ